MSKSKRKLVKDIVDGDTFKTNNNRIRIAGINTPEKGEKNYYKAKRDLASIMPIGKFVNITKVARDKYGRHIAHVINKKGNIATQMKKRGYGNKRRSKNMNKISRK